MGMHEKGGKLVTAIVPDTKRVTLWAEIEKTIARGTTLHTDESSSYGSITLRDYRHQRLNHSKGEWVNASGVTTNSVEDFWAQLKRSINGTHIHVSRQHLAKYLGEFEYRHNRRQFPHLMLDELMTGFVR